MKTLLIIMGAIGFAVMARGAELAGPFWKIRTDALRLVGVSIQLRDPRNVVDEPWVVTEIEYRLASDRAAVVVTEGRVGILDPKRKETPLIVSNTVRTEHFAASFVACKEDAQYTVGLSVQPRREAHEPDRGNAAVYFSVRAVALGDAIATLDALFSQSSFGVGAYGEAEPADQALAAFVKAELRTFSDAAEGDRL